MSDNKHDAANGFDPHLHALAMANSLGLSIDAAWQETITSNLVMLEQAAHLLSDLQLPDDAESALVFHPIESSR